MFKRATENKFIVVEVEKGTRPSPLTPEMREGLTTLQHSVAFQHISQRLKYERSLLEKYLHEGFHLPESQLRHLQAGVYWLGYIDEYLRTSTRTPESPRHEADFDEAAEFSRIHKQLSFVE